MHSKSSLKWLLFSSVALVIPAYASTIEFNGFSSVSGLTLNGDTHQAGNVLRLTPASTWQSGSVFSTSTLALNNLNSFSTRFQFQITNSGGITDENGTGADGLVFAVQTVANNVGGGGVGIGYSGINPSVGIEFDTYNNGAADDYNGNHVGVDINGSVNSVVQTAILPKFNNGNIWTAWVDYDGGTNQIEVRLNQTGLRPTPATLSYNVNLATVLGSPNAYVGFTSGTGSAWGDHDLLNWKFESNYAPIGSVPDHANTLVLILCGFVGLCGLSRLGCINRQQMALAARSR